MKTQPVLILAALATLLLLGCEESTTSPCIDCSSGDLHGRVTEEIERVFHVSESPTISVENFTGRVLFRPSEPGVVHVKAIRRAERRSQLSQIEVFARADGNTVEIITVNPDELRHASVDLEIAAPLGSTPRLHTAVGEIDYEGSPSGRCRLWTAVGSIRMRLPRDVNITFELHAAVGSIRLEDPFGGEVQTELGVVRGRIGTGEDGHVVAGAAVGSIRISH